MPASNPNTLPVTEALTRFHNQWAGTSTEVFGRGALGDGRSSYDWLTASIRRGPVLDLGCGDGGLLASLDVPGVGLDQNEAELAIAQARALSHADFVVADAVSLPFSDARFEHVVSHMALMLMPEVDEVAREIDRVLAPGGQLGLVINRRSATTLPAIRTYMKGLRSLIEAHGPVIDYPSVSWNGAAVQERFPGWTVQEEPLMLQLSIPVEDVPRFLKVSFYNASLLNNAGKPGLEELIRAVIDTYAEDGHLAWQTALLGVTARKPF